MQIEMITDVQIDLYGEKQYYKASAKQGDKNTRYLRVQLMNNGNEFQIPDDVILIANIKKPDGKFCYNECMKRENRVMVQLTNQALAAAGTAYCDIEMRDENGELILSSAVFTIEIEQGMRNEGAMESSNEMTFIDKKFAEMKAMHDKVAEMKAEVEEAKNQVEDTYEAYVEALENHAKDTENPHKVSREQLKVEKTDNTSDMDKPVSIAQQAALDALYEQLAAYTRQQIANLINGAPSSLDTLKEVADAIAAHKTIMDALDAAIGKKAS
ncbi:BppU family phage baseplate upper protein, partial [uncultured Acetatifactor sp.]|uniref:BppU family phage baseplate upper protein n=1 Tax=uncultured Acetatifactor sp. TaxID=1671927 RepID=UPI0026115A02